MLRDDSERPHRARLVDNFPQQVGVTKMEWPACSPDVNLIENLGDLLERRVQENQPPPQVLQQLFGLLQMEWQAMPQVELKILAESMRRRRKKYFFSPTL